MFVIKIITFYTMLNSSVPHKDAKLYKHKYESREECLDDMSRVRDLYIKLKAGYTLRVMEISCEPI